MWISAKLPGIVWNLTLRQLSRNSGQYMPLLLLLILTVSLGIYTASTARTLDRNFVDQIYFGIGADLSLTERWTVPGVGQRHGVGGDGPGAAPARPLEPRSGSTSRRSTSTPSCPVSGLQPESSRSAPAARAGGRFLGEVGSHGDHPLGVRPDGLVAGRPLARTTFTTISTCSPAIGKARSSRGRCLKRRA